MKSLRGQLLFGVALGTTAVLLVSGALLYGLIRRTLWADFDEALAAKARSLAALAEQDEEGVDFELPESSLPEFASARRPEYFQIWRADGTELARSASLRGRDLERVAGEPEVPSLRSVLLPDGRPGRVAGLTFAPRQEFLADAPMMLMLVVGREVAAVEGILARVRGTMFGVALIAVGLQAGVLILVVRRSLRPVHRLVTQIADLGADDLSKPIHAAGIPEELSPVADRLNDLLARLDAAFCRERRFTGDVAHELRTPLAGLRAKLELALSRDRAADVYRKAMDDCLQINLQMQRMVENLLHLARADAGQLEIRRETVDLSALMRECWRPLQENAARRGLNVVWPLDSNGALETDRDKLQLVIQNVLDNAVAYTDQGGRITMSTWAKNGTIAIAVSNTGNKVGADQVQHVFDRFWRGDPSFRQSTEGHCGLGLPLCKTIVEQLGGLISADVESADLFTITIQLPAQSAGATRGR